MPWETHYRGKFDPEFEKWMARSLMQYPAFQNLMAGELLIKVRKHISAGKYDLKRRDELFRDFQKINYATDNNDNHLKGGEGAAVGSPFCSNLNND